MGQKDMIEKISKKFTMYLYQGFSQTQKWSHSVKTEVGAK